MSEIITYALYLLLNGNHYKPFSIILISVIIFIIDTHIIHEMVVTHLTQLSHITTQKSKIPTSQILCGINLER